MFRPLTKFWEDFGEAKDRAHHVLKRDLTDSEEDSLFINHLRSRLDLPPSFDSFRMIGRKGVCKPKIQRK